ncbi:hypothetical protein CesoFtcFv8_025680 [Champsocephalus esox]|uniref:Uncharacterized protein n=1 Tax=Champsocephalus esox TaxID=159716 RepID=A0AAN8B0T4_9TELE|nr:hypothetical protein CesoFtcFv8_025680 [Champsocephalus esox]
MVKRKAFSFLQTISPGLMKRPLSFDTSTRLLSAGRSVCRVAPLPVATRTPKPSQASGSWLLQGGVQHGTRLRGPGCYREGCSTAPGFGVLVATGRGAARLRGLVQGGCSTAPGFGCRSGAALWLSSLQQFHREQCAIPIVPTAAAAAPPAAYRCMRNHGDE